MVYDFVEEAVSGAYEEAMDEFEGVLERIENIDFQDITERKEPPANTSRPFNGARRNYSAERGGASTSFVATLQYSRAQEGDSGLEPGTEIAHLNLLHTDGGDEESRELFRGIGEELDELFQGQYRAHVLGPRLRDELDRQYAFELV